MTHVFNSWGVKCINDAGPISFVSGAGMNAIHRNTDA
jgi:hypothetical protein